MGEASLLILLGLMLVVTMVFHRLGVSALVAYLATGALAGPGILGLVDQHQIGPLAEIGASLLLFSLGLEMDVDGLRRHGRTLVIAAPLQIGLTVLAIGGLWWLLAEPVSHGVALGACLAISSTLLLLRALEERRWRTRPEGQVSLAMSLSQDVALGPLLIVLSFLIPVGQQPHWSLQLGGLAACLIATWAVRRALGSALIARIRATQLPELEVAFAVMMALGAAALTHASGLGSALGAFSAGLALGAPQHARAIDISVRPLQALTAIFFFVATGAMFDPLFVWQHLGLVLSALVVGVVVKIGIASLALGLGGLSWRSALGCGLLLGTIGEFSFVLAAAAFANSEDPAVQRLYQLVVAVTFLSFLSMPLLVRLAARYLPRSNLETITASGATIVVAGLGPVGNTVVETLRDHGHPLFLIDRNRSLLRTWDGSPGVTTHYGRIEDMEEWLPLVGHRPSLVVLTFPIADASAAVARRLRELDPSLTILARSPFEAQIATLRAAGVQYVICDEHETARALLPLLRDALRSRGVSAETAIFKRSALGIDRIDKTTSSP